MRYCVILCIFPINFLIILSVAAGKCLVPDELIPELYSKYREAVSSGGLRSYRRLLKENREYKIHVKKLKEVNGYKRHNLRIKEIARDGSPLSTFYINNPLESKMPNSFLTFSEFKDALTNRANQKRMSKKKITLKGTLKGKISKKNKNKDKNPLRSPEKLKAKSKRRAVKSKDIKNMKLIKHSRGKLYLRNKKFNYTNGYEHVTYFPHVESTKFKKTVDVTKRTSSRILAEKNSKNNIVKLPNIPLVGKKVHSSNVTTANATEKNVDAPTASSSASEVNLRNNDVPITTPATETPASGTDTTVRETDTTLSETQTTANDTETAATETETTVSETITTVSETETGAIETETTVSETETTTSETETTTAAADTETNVPLTDPPSTKRSTLARPLVFMGGNK
ncbi:uncharacterized protein LOC128678541 [Plodia interpunctella]|uniref:uncharacterized protein LOC128678541 n=1 Tax=Plodia interpunctella TaxID=58824 RepID=UPI0023688920|nr:uncharacterized protein LOC128678541 [Plodia interpunctella]